MQMEEFIDNTSSLFWMDLLNQWFLLMHVEAISSIPLSTRRLDDLWVWQYDRNGLLPVRSVYRMLVQTKTHREDWLKGRAAGSNTEEEGKAWTRLWKMQVPSKLRVFLWRPAHQSLPTGDVRQHRQMATHSLCSVFGEEDSWRHSLINCSVARCVWALAEEEIVEHVGANEHPSAKTWLFAMMESMPRDEFAKLGATLWSIWYA
jgi:hypothetical protein